MRPFAPFTFSSLLGLAALALAQNQKVNFNQVANINGDVSITWLDIIYAEATGLLTWDEIDAT